MKRKKNVIVRTTNDKVLEVYVIEDNIPDDGIWYNVIDRNSPSPVPVGTEITGTNIIKKSVMFPGESIKRTLIDTNHLDHPSGYVISLCFSTEVGTTSKLYMGRVSSSSSGVTWTQCADSPRTYTNSKILSIHSSFLNVDGGKPIKILNILNTLTDDQIVIMEHH
ncbi:MAG: hypothetical protein H0U27_09755 [Nitrosopumilus sp.]|nr:hypothetical protein [Nitrosopumilus sp.]